MPSLMNETVEVQRQAIKLCAELDYQRHKEAGIDLNPFATETTRSFWSKGFNGVTVENLTEGSFHWRAWERGRQVRILKDQDERNNQPE